MLFAVYMDMSKIEFLSDSISHFPSKAKRAFFSLLNNLFIFKSQKFKCNFIKILSIIKKIPQILRKTTTPVFARFIAVLLRYLQRIWVELHFWAIQFQIVQKDATNFPNSKFVNCDINYLFYLDFIFKVFCFWRH